MEDPAHYRLAPSSASRWLECPGSARDDLPDEKTEASSLGDLAHEIAYQRLTDAPSAPWLPWYVEDHQTCQELEEAIRTYVTYVQEIYGTYCLFAPEEAGTSLWIEYKLKSKFIHDHGGTIDALILAPGKETTTLHVIDFKSGTYPVRAEGNLQLACYLNLAREHFPQAEVFKATIVQPRVGESAFEETEFTRRQLDDVRLAVIEASVSEELALGDHCRFCPLITTCPEVERSLRESVERDFPPLTLPMEEPTRRRLVELMELGPIAQALAEKARLELLGELTRGGSVPGYKLTRSKKNRRWRDEEAALQILATEYPDLTDRFSTSKIISPAQIEKLITAEALRQLDLVERPEGGLTIVPETSNSPTIAVDDFDILPEFVD